MADKVSQSDLQASAKDVLTRKSPTSLSRRGAQKDQEEWDTLRGKACRLLLADPDAAVYLAYLASNRLSSAVRDFHAFLCECIVLAESNFSINEETLEEKEVLRQKSTELAGTIAALRTSFDRRDDVLALKQAVAGFVEEVAKTSTKRRRFERSRSSRTDLATIAEELVPLSSKIVALAANLGNVTVSESYFLMDGARDTILPDMVSALRQQNQLDPKTTALRLASGVAAYDAFSRPTAKTFIVHTGIDFPEKIQVEQSGTSLRLTDSKGTRINPLTLGIAAGQGVFVSGTKVAVSSVTASEVIVDSPLSSTVGLIIRTTAQEQLQNFVSTLDQLPYSKMSSIASVVVGNRLRKLNRPEAYKMVARLSELAVLFAELTPEATRSTRILDVDVAPAGTLLSDIRTFSPDISKRTSSAVDEVLFDLRSKSLDRVADLLVETRLSVLGTKDVSQCRNATMTSKEVGEIFELFNPILSL